MRLLLATTNPSKIEALAERVDPGLEIGCLESGAGPGPPETQRSFGEIAAEKATWHSRERPGVTVIATDGGLTIPALGPAWNPVETARFAGRDASGLDRALALLEICARLTGPDRRIGWSEAMSVAVDGRLLETWTANSPPGVLADDLPPELYPASGFWVPWLWRCPEYGNRRLSDLTRQERLGRRDHWAILGEYLSAWTRGSP